MIRISKTIVAGMSALAMAAAVVLPTTPASAGGWRRRWLARRRLGTAAAGMAAAGMAAAGTAAAGMAAGWGGRGVWHPGYWRGGYWYNGWWGPAVAAGVLAGAAIATYPYWGGGYGYGGGCWQFRPTYDAYGNYLGQQSVNVC